MTNPMFIRALRSVRAVRSAFTVPPYVAPGHFYSPMTLPIDTERAIRWTQGAASTLPGLDLAEDKQLALVGQISGLLTEPLPGPRYTPQNKQYGLADGSIYRAMLNYLRPSHLIEVGSGFSTAIALDEIDHGLPDMTVTCIEPYPKRLLGLMKESDQGRLTLLRKPVQDVPLNVYGQLAAGDLLFIDSTHVVKAGSDVNWLFLHVLPQLALGVVIHVHDVFWPFEYPKAWLNEHRDWTEDYLLHAFLTGNSSWEIMMFSSWLWRCHPDMVPAHLANQEPGSIWLRRIA